VTTEKLLHLAFTAQRLDYIAQVLGQRPYAEVAAVLADIQQQLTQQQRESEPVFAGTAGNGRDTSAEHHAKG
jgi:hypothetical protein